MRVASTTNRILGVYILVLVLVGGKSSLLQCEHSPGAPCVSGESEGLWNNCSGRKVEKVAKDTNGCVLTHYSNSLASAFHNLIYASQSM